MKKIFLLLIASATLFSCSKPADTSAEDANLATFKENSKIVQTLFDGYSKADFSQYDELVADSVMFIPPSVNADTLNKADNLKGLQMLRSLQAKVNYSGLKFFPAVDSVTYKPDGNVRVFARWTSDGKNGAHLFNNYFAVFRFNSAHKLIYAVEYQDIKGAVDALTAPAK
jgi:ketosteroid isomerase-like protein